MGKIFTKYLSLPLRYVNYEEGASLYRAKFPANEVFTKP
jgi:hypothetical protein